MDDDGVQWNDLRTVAVDTIRFSFILGQPQRLAIVMPWFFEQAIGGAEYQCYLLAEAAKKLGHEVHYIYVSNGKPCENHLRLHLHPMKALVIQSGRFGSLLSFYDCQISRILKTIRPDVLYVRGGVSFAGMTAGYAKRYGVRSIWHIASSADVTPRPLWSMLKRPLNLIERKAIGYAIKHSTHVVAHARYQAELLMKNYGRAAEVILKEQPTPTEALVKRGPFTVVWVANIKPLKQPEKFIRLAKEYAAEQNVHFIMIGRPAGGEYQARLESEMRALPNYSYLGEQPIEEVNRVLARSHVFVNTSTYEGLPNTFVQSWMREVPVVSMLLDPDDILTTQKIGFFSGSFEQMVRDIRNLIDNPALRDEMGRRAREYALEHHALEKNMGRLLEFVFGESAIPPAITTKAAGQK